MALPVIDKYLTGGSAYAQSPALQSSVVPTPVIAPSAAPASPVSRAQVPAVVNAPKPAPPAATAAPIVKTNQLFDKYMGQDPIQMAKQAGLTEEEYRAGAAKYPDNQPDALIGSLLMLKERASVKPPPTIPQPEQNLSQNTSQNRSVRSDNKSAATDILSNLTTIDSSAIAKPTAPGDAMSDAEVQAMKAQRDEAARLSRLANEGQWTPEQQAQINAAAEAAKLRYQKMVDDAEQARARDLPKAQVAIGQAGGMLSTQLMGQEALVGTNVEGRNIPGKDRFGYTGGEAGFITDTYQRAVAYANQAQQAAIAEAENAAKMAIRTGKEADLENAQKAFESAKEQANKKLQLAQDYQRDLMDWSVKNESVISSKQQRALQLLEKTQEQGTNKLDVLTSGGYTYEDLSPEALDSIQSETGWDEMQLKAYMNAKGKASKKDYKVEIKGNYAVMTGIDPKTGKLDTTVSMLEGLPPNAEGEYTERMADNGQMILTPKVIDPSRPMSEQIIVYGTPGQFNKPKATGGGSVGVSVPGFKPDEVNTAVEKYFEKFGSRPAKADIPQVVKEFWRANVQSNADGSMTIPESWAGAREAQLTSKNPVVDPLEAQIAESMGLSSQ